MVGDGNEYQRTAYVPRPFARTYMALIFGGAALAAGAYFGIMALQSVPFFGQTFEEKQAQARLEALKVALTTVAGVAALSGIYVSYRRQRTEESNSYRDQDRAFTDRFGAATAQLAGETSVARLAGTKALARLADDSERDRNACLNHLCDYLRQPVSLKASEEAEDDESRQSRLARRSQWANPDEWDVRRSAAKLLFERIDHSVTDPWDLRESVLIDVDFDRISTTTAGIDFRHSVIVGDVNLRGRVTGGSIIFDDCYFASNVDIWEVLIEAPISFAGASFSGQFMYDCFGTWTGMMPLLQDCIFLSDVEILRNLKYAFVQSRGLHATTVKLQLQGSQFKGHVTLPDHAVDISAADFSEAASIAIIAYGEQGLVLSYRGDSLPDRTEPSLNRFTGGAFEEGNPQLSLAVWDSHTKWPPGFDPFSTR